MPDSVRPWRPFQNPEPRHEIVQVERFARDGIVPFFPGFSPDPFQRRARQSEQIPAEKIPRFEHDPDPPASLRPHGRGREGDEPLPEAPPPAPPIIQPRKLNGPPCPEPAPFKFPLVTKGGCDSALVANPAGSASDRGFVCFAAMAALANRDPLFSAHGCPLEALPVGRRPAGVPAGNVAPVKREGATLGELPASSAAALLCQPAPPSFPPPGPPDAFQSGGPFLAPHGRAGLDLAPPVLQIPVATPRNHCAYELATYLPLVTW